MAVFKLPRLNAKVAIVDEKGRPTAAFLQMLNVQWAMAIERKEAGQDAALAAIAQVQAQQQAQLVLINEALVLAGIALAQADAGSADDRSGSAASPDITLSGTGWVTGPLVTLSTVSAGTLQLMSSGIQADANTTLANFDEAFEGEFRIMEVVGGVDTEIVGSPFVITAERYDVNPSGAVFVTNDARIPTFSEARSSTGTVAYRMDLRRVSGPTLSNVRAYLFARRKL